MFSKSKQLKIVDKYCEIIDKKLNIVNLIDSLQDLERLKYVLFDKSQLSVFNMPYRADLKNEYKNLKRSTREEEKNLNLNDAMKDYQSVKSSVEMKKMNQNLLDKISEHYKLIFH